MKIVFHGRNAQTFEPGFQDLVGDAHDVVCIADLPSLEARMQETLGYAGGGAMPMHALPGVAIALRSARFGAEHLARRLRTGATRVLGRIERDVVLLDLRTVADAELPALAQAIRDAA